jgi:hypothetical protein
VDEIRRSRGSKKKENCGKRVQEEGGGGERGPKRRTRKGVMCKKSEAKEAKDLPYCKNRRVGHVHTADQKTKTAEPNGKKHRPNLICF